MLVSFSRPGRLPRSSLAAFGTLLACSGAQALPADGRCLLDELRRAAPDTTVEQIRAACADAGRLAQPRIAAPSEPAQTAAPSPAEVPAAEAPREIALESPVRRRIDDEALLWGERFALLPHRPNYLHPFSHALNAPMDAGSAAGDHMQRSEVKFQISFKFPLTKPLFDGRAALFFGYTGQSWWQAYNKNRSSPFREYSHEPELFASWAPGAKLFGWDWRIASLGFVHQSNGRSGEFSRSWNRLSADFKFDRPGPWWVGVRPWVRLREDAKETPEAARGDDNPDITRYLGHGELRIGYAGATHNWTLMVRRSLSSGGKGAAQLDYSRPSGISPQLRWHVQYFDGYGENLLDYQTRVRRIGVGIMLNDWF
ncbi:MAG: phospholipase A [Burkholderiales bacterium]|nr:phospholipase A [Burkholderiales bacterium]